MAEEPIHILVHEFAGHPFQAELSRKLAARGHRVTHLTLAGWVSCKGLIHRLPDDPPTLTFDQVTIDRPITKYSPRARLAWELEYGSAAARRLDDRPDVVIVNTPLVSMGSIVRRANKDGVPWVFWHQDIWSIAMGDEVRRRFPRPLAGIAARGLERFEAWCARSAGHVVAIGQAFTQVYPRWGVDADRVSVIPNWAPVGVIRPLDRDNGQTDILFGEDRSPAILRLLYAGSLGRKHNPLLLVELLRHVRDAGVDAVLTVVSEGDGADDLRAAAAAEPTLPLRVVGFQPADSLSETLSSADVLLALLEPEATAFSIPSKVLSYMAAGRPIVGLMPRANDAASDIADCGGFVAEPTHAGAEAAAAWIVGVARDPMIRAEIGARTREIAEERFDPERITDRFESVLCGLARRQRGLA
jgi:glycosyltransferase involved in cell wall biosynthesis